MKSNIKFMIVCCILTLFSVSSGAGCVCSGQNQKTDQACENGCPNCATTK
jgi:hypothetical protein